MGNRTVCLVSFNEFTEYVLDNEVVDRRIPVHCIGKTEPFANAVKSNCSEFWDAFMISAGCVLTLDTSKTEVLKCGVPWNLNYVNKIDPVSIIQIEIFDSIMETWGYGFASMQLNGHHSYSDEICDSEAEGDYDLRKKALGQVFDNLAAIKGYLIIHRSCINPELLHGLQDYARTITDYIKDPE